MSLLVDIKKNYGKFKLNVRFEGEAGVSGLLGASGCGKSLTLKAIAGIEHPDSGRIILDGRTLFDSERGIDLSPQERRVGYLFQSYALFPNMTAAQNIGVGVRERAQRKQIVEELIHAFRLEEVSRKYPRQLSGGQQQRVALARILAGRPDALLLDEPFSALDSHLKGQLYGELQRVLEGFSGVTLFVTHDREEVRTFCRSVCVLEHGKSQTMEDTTTLFQAPGTVAACRLVGCENLLQARVGTEGRVFIPDWNTELDLPLVPDQLIAVGIRAMDLQPAEGPGKDTLFCHVIAAAEQAFSVKLTGSLPNAAAPIYAEIRRDRWRELGQPSELWLKIRTDRVLPLTEH